MAADSKTRRSGGRNADDDKRSGSRRGAGDEDGKRGAKKGAAKSARKAESTGRKSGARKEASGGRKTAAKKSARKSSAKDSGGRAAAGRKAAKKSGASKSAGRARKTKMDALSLLKDDHERVDAMFRKYERMKEGDERKQQLLEDILEEVRVHAQVEEELFYPALRTVLEEDGKEKELKLVAEADVEHETVKWLMAELDGGRMEQEMVDARVKVMGEYVRHHVEEEEGQMFRAAKRSDIDLEELGRQMDARKRELMGEAPEEDAGAMGDMAGMAGSDSAQRAAPAGTH